MIDKLVVHLKNIIFFKIIIYLLVTLILALLIPVFITDLEKAYERKQKAISFLRETTLKIESIQDFEEKITSLNNIYNELATSAENVICTSQTKFIKSLHPLNSKYQLFEPITIQISKGYEANEALPSSHIKMSYHTADISFKALDTHQLLAIIQDIYKIMPLGSIVLATNIRSIDSLTPEIIEALTPAKAPELLEVKIKILLRDIVYDK